MIEVNNYSTQDGPINIQKDTIIYKKILFVNQSVPDRNVLTDNISKTVKLVENNDSFDIINYSDVEQIGFIWKNEWRGYNKPVFPRFDYFDEKSNFNKSIFEIVKNFPNLKYVDLITCDLKENSEWADEFKNLRKSLNINAEIRYSTNKTGSKTLGADWILEVGKVSVLDEYYDGKDIQYNQHLAPSPIQSLNDFLHNFSSVNLNGGIITFTDNIEINVNIYPEFTDISVQNLGKKTKWASILIDSNIKLIDGNGYTIKFKNSTSPIASLFYIPITNYLEIKDLIINSVSAHGFNGIVYSDFDNPVNNVTVRNCGVHTLSPNSTNGLIFGGSAASNNNVSGTCTATAIACYTTGNINLNFGSCIFGGSAASNNSGNGTCTATAIACYTTGNITTNYGSCIFGGSAASNYGSGTCTALAIACYTTGDITTNYGGFIFGNYAAASNSNNTSRTCNATAIACYTTGNITTNNGSCIFGNNVACNIYIGSSVNCTATAIACYTTGNISTNNGGCIFGSISSKNVGSGTCTSTAIACYTTGNITTTNDGGFIFGNNVACGSSICIATAISCYTTGYITTNKGGCIFGNSVASEMDMKGTRIVTAIACYTTGFITTNTYGGFIFGKNAAICFSGDYPYSTGKASAIACYTTGYITTNNGGFIFGKDASSKATTIECYILNNTNNKWFHVTDNTITTPSYSITSHLPDSMIFNYDPLKSPKDQLQLRFFSALPWNPFSPIKQAPFLLDWNYSDQLIASHFKDLLYIDPSIIYQKTILTIDDVKNMLKSVTGKSTLGTLPNDIMEPITINTVLKIDDVIYTIQNPVPAIPISPYYHYNGSPLQLGTSYRISGQFPIIAEFFNNKSLYNPFLKNFSLLNNYNFTKSLWLNIISGYYNNEMIANNIEMPSIQIHKKCKMNFINKDYCATLVDPIELSSNDLIYITFILPATINNFELLLNEINVVSIYLTAIYENGLYKLLNLETKIIKNTKSSIMIVGSFNTNELISCITEIRYSIKINTINVRFNPCLKSESNKYNGISYISISKL